MSAKSLEHFCKDPFKTNDRQQRCCEEVMIARKKIYRAYKPTGSYEKISFRTVDTKKANGPKSFAYFILKELAEWTGLEPATPGVTGRYSNQLNYHSSIINIFCSWEVLAEWTGLEPATLGVTGRYSNQLNYHSILGAYWTIERVGGVDGTRTRDPRRDRPVF